MFRLLKTTPEVVFFAALAVLWMYPLVTDLSGQVPGFGAGDSLEFLWAFWWMREALASSASLFHTTYMFVPVGAPLVLHTMTPFPAFVAATVLGSLPVAAAMNLTILASFTLNGFCAYLLGWQLTRDRAGAVIGGMVFGGSSYLFSHLLGHFNLTTAWTIPLFALLLLRAMRGSIVWAIAAGLVLGLTAYIDYYYLVFECCLTIVIAATTAWDWSVEWRGRGSVTRMKAARVVAALALLTGVLILAIVVTGGFAFNAGARRISVRGLFNPSQIFWLLVAIWTLLRFRPRLALTPLRSVPAISARVAVVFASLLVCAVPLMQAANAVFSSGDYVTQKYFWRSAPSGFDLGTLVMGPPMHGLAGPAVRNLYGKIGLGRVEDLIETSGWLGIVPVILAIAALRRHRGDPDVRQWRVIGLVFVLWSLGPHLIVFGNNTGMILPQALLRYVPVVNNARFPARAVIMVMLALSVLSAFAIARWRLGLKFVSGIAALLLIESLPAPFPMVALPQPHLYEMVRDRSEPGAVMELPLGIRDGFGERGYLDTMVFQHQTVHRRPLVGGYVARLPPSVVRAYAEDPLLNSLLELSERNTQGGLVVALDAGAAAAHLKKIGVAFVVLDRAIAPQRLIDYVEKVMPLTLVTTEGERSLFVVRKP